MNTIKLTARRASGARHWRAGASGGSARDRRRTASSAERSNPSRGRASGSPAAPDARAITDAGRPCGRDAPPRAGRRGDEGAPPRAGRRGDGVSGARSSREDKDARLNVSAPTIRTTPTAKATETARSSTNGTPPVFAPLAASPTRLAAHPTDKTKAGRRSHAPGHDTEGMDFDAESD